MVLVDARLVLKPPRPRQLTRFTAPPRRAGNRQACTCRFWHIGQFGQGIGQMACSIGHFAGCIGHLAQSIGHFAEFIGTQVQFKGLNGARCRSFPDGGGACQRPRCSDQEFLSREGNWQPPNSSVISHTNKQTVGSLSAPTVCLINLSISHRFGAR